jgi:hypothetical protein
VRKSAAFHVRFYQTETSNGEIARAQNSKKLATIASCERKTAGEGGVRVGKGLARKFMREVNGATPPATDDLTVRDFWERRAIRT